MRCSAHSTTMIALAGHDTVTASTVGGVAISAVVIDATVINATCVVLWSNASSACAIPYSVSSVSCASSVVGFAVSSVSASTAAVANVTLTAVSSAATCISTNSFDSPTSNYIVAASAVCGIAVSSCGSSVVVSIESTTMSLCGTNSSSQSTAAGYHVSSATSIGGASTSCSGSSAVVLTNVTLHGNSSNSNATSYCNALAYGGSTSSVSGIAIAASQGNNNISADGAVIVVAKSMCSSCARGVQNSVATASVAGMAVASPLVSVIAMLADIVVYVDLSMCTSRSYADLLGASASIGGVAVSSLTADVTLNASVMSMFNSTVNCTSFITVGGSFVASASICGIALSSNTGAIAINESSFLLTEIRASCSTSMPVGGGNVVALVSSVGGVAVSSSDDITILVANTLFQVDSSFFLNSTSVFFADQQSKHIACSSSVGGIAASAVTAVNITAFNVTMHLNEPSDERDYFSGFRLWHVGIICGWNRDCNWRCGRDGGSAVHHLFSWVDKRHGLLVECCGRKRHFVILVHRRSGSEHPRRKWSRVHFSRRACPPFKRRLIRQYDKKYAKRGQYVKCHRHCHQWW